MGRTTKADYAEVERKYVVDERSYRSLAAEYGLSVQTIAERGKKEDWPGKRLAYQAAIKRRSYEKMADGIATESAAIKSEAIMVARATLRRYAQDIVEGKIAVTAKDAAIMIELLVKELAPDSSREAEGDTVIVGAKPDADILRRVVEAARQRGAPTGDLATTALVSSEGTRTH